MTDKMSDAVLIGAEVRPRATLRRSLSLSHAILYGLGVTIGAGIYVLIGAAVARAGVYAPAAFVLAALLMAMTAASLAELGGRMPVAAGEAAYVREAFSSDRAATVVGLLVVVIAIVSAAAISVGSVGYISAFIDLPQPVLAAGVVIGMATIAAWGIRESVTFAGVMTLIEVGGLVMVIAAGIFLGTNEAGSAPSLPAPPFEPHLIVGILSASLLAVFAFIGFEGLVNVAEELRDPKRNLPRAIFITLALTTLLYVLVVWVSLRAVPPEELGAASAPLALVFERITGLSSKTMSVIAVVATLNGIIVQIIMSSRVLYGLARQGNLPSAFQDVNSVTRTPLTATIFTSVLVLALAVSLPLDQLAEMTSRVTLVLFALMNVALIRIKLREPAAPGNGYVAPLWVPWAGVTTCLALLGVDLIFVLAR